MRKLVTAALPAAVAMPVIAAPTAASAQSRQELRRDRQEIREEQRDLNRAYRSGDPRQIRSQQRDVRQARQEYREDLQDRNRRWGDNDWRDYRGRNRTLYSRGNWRAPFRYTQFRAGVRIAPSYYSSRYWIADPWTYRLRRPGAGLQWIRYGNDAVLVNTRTGRVVEVNNGFFW